MWQIKFRSVARIHEIIYYLVCSSFCGLPLTRWLCVLCIVYRAYAGKIETR